MALVAASFNWTPNPDNTRDGRWRGGTKPPVIATLQWDSTAFALAIAPLAQVTTGGGAYSLNVRALLQGSTSATATITIRARSGSVANFTSPGSGDNLTHPDSTDVGGVAYLEADDGGTLALSPDFAFAFAAPPVADTTAPVKGHGLTAIPGSGIVTLSCDVGWDPHGASEPGKGVQDVQFLLGGSVITAATTAVAAGLSLAITDGTLGSPGGSTTHTAGAVRIQHVAAGTLLGAGAGPHSDVGRHSYVTHTGNFVATLYIESISGVVNQYAKVGIMARASTAQGATAVMAAKFGSNTGVALEARGTDSAARTQVQAPAVGYSFPIWIQLERVGDVFTMRVSPDGNNWVQVSQGAIALPSTLLIGPASGSLDASAITVQYDHFSVNNLPRVEYEHTTGVGGSYTCRYRDRAGTPNVGTVSAAVIAVPTSPAIERKWHPGVYVQTNGLSQDQASRFANMDTICTNHPNVKGVGVKTRGGTLWTGDGQYNFAPVTADLNRLRTQYGTLRRYHLRIYVKVFAGGTVTNPTPGQYIPAFILQNSIYRATGDTYTGFAPTNSGYMLNWWWPPTLAKLIEFYQAMGDQFDDDEAFENIVIMDETATSFANNPPPSWSNTAGLNALIAMMEQIKPYWPKTNVIMPYNFSGFPDHQVATLMQAIYDNKCGIGGPDTRVNSAGGPVESTFALTGQVSGVPSYIDKIPVAYNAENAPDFSGETIAGVQNFSYNTLHSTHVVWQYRTAGSTGNWALLAPQIDAGNLPTRTGCPECYDGACAA